MNDAYSNALMTSKRHAERLTWARSHIAFPLNAETLKTMDGLQHAILDQFSTRFAKLQDAMGAKLFPAVLELVKESANLGVFIDQLNRLEKIGAIPSAEDWLLLREMRNQFAHDYPDDPEIQASLLNKANELSSDLLATLDHIERFAQKYQ